MKFEISKGTFRRSQAETYQEIYDLWIVQYEKAVEESMFTKTAGLFRNHILPEIGQNKIEK